MRALLIGFGWLLATAVVPLHAADSLFADPVRAKGKGIEIRESEVEEGYMAYKAARAAMGQPVPDALESQVKEQVLEKLIATKLLLARATSSDRETGSTIAERLIEEGRRKAPSEASYRRQLIAVGTTPEKYEADILEQAIVKAVIDRELKSRHPVTDAAVREYYEKHPELFTRPEQLKVAHILISNRDLSDGQLLSPKAQAARKAKAEEIAARAKTGEDFTALVEEFSQDPDRENTKGVLTFGRKGPVPLEFEAAAFSLEPGQVSDVVRSVIGFHVIKLLERVPAQRRPMEEVENAIRESLQQQHVQESLEGFLQKLRTEAGLQLFPAE